MKCSTWLSCVVQYLPPEARLTHTRDYTFCSGGRYISSVSFCLDSPNAGEQSTRVGPNDYLIISSQDQLINFIYVTNYPISFAPPAFIS